MSWASEFPRWYIGAFELIIALFALIRARPMSDLRPYFRREIKDADLGSRFAVALTRRRVLEAIPPTPWYVIGAVSLGLGILTVVQAVPPIVSYATLVLIMSSVLTFVFVRLRNRSDRRAASLQPRVAVAPWWVYLSTVVMVLTPISYVTNPATAFSATIVALVGTILIVVASIAVNGMAALLTGDDPEIEAIVDERIRFYRVASLLFGANAVAFVFMSMTFGMTRPMVGYQFAAYLLSLLAWTVMTVWYASSVWRKAKLAPRVHV